MARVRAGADGRVGVTVLGEGTPQGRAVVRAVVAHPGLALDPGGSVVVRAAAGEDPRWDAAALGVDLVGRDPAVPVVLPELGAEGLFGADRVRVPGPVALALLLALWPLRGRMRGRVPAFVVSGPLRDVAVDPGPYDVLAHPDVADVERLVDDLAVDVVPFAAAVGAVLWATVRLPAAPRALWEGAWAGHALVAVGEEPPTAAMVAGRPVARVAVVEGPGSTAVVVALDRLARHAGAGAVSAVNLALGWPPALGLVRPD